MSNGGKDILIFNISEEILSLKHNFFLIKVYKRQNFYQNIFKITDTRDGYYYAHFDYLEIRLLLGNAYKKSLEYLESNGYIIVHKDLKDSHGNFTIKISIGPKTELLKLTRVKRDNLKETFTGKDALRRIETHSNSIKVKEINIYNSPVMEHVAKTILQTKIELSRPEFISIYKSRYQESEKNLTEEEYVNHGLRMWDRLKELQKNNDIYDVMEYLTISPYGKRLYHPMISFVKEIRAYITFNHERTISYDIKNSQLAFLAIMLKIEYKNDVLFKMIENDVDIYNLVADKKGISRKEAKNLIFKNIFGPRTKEYDQDLVFLFGEKTLQEIDILKYTKPLETNKIKGKPYSWLAYRLQLLESDFAIRQLGKILNLNNIPFIPIHDEFIIPFSFDRQFELALNISFFELNPFIDASKVIKLKKTINNAPNSVDNLLNIYAC